MLAIDRLAGSMLVAITLQVQGVAPAPTPVIAIPFPIAPAIPAIAVLRYRERESVEVPPRDIKHRIVGLDSRAVDPIADRRPCGSPTMVVLSCSVGSLAASWSLILGSAIALPANPYTVLALSGRVSRG